MNNLFFNSSKLAWMLISPDHLLLLILTLGILLSLTYRWRRFGYSLSLLSLLLAWAIALLPLSDWILRPLEDRFAANPQLPAQVDGIIVLGGSVLPRHSQRWQQLESNSTQERLVYFADLARRYPDARLVFSGGSGSLYPMDPTEAEILKHHVEKLGLDPSRVEFEKQSRNTHENALYSKQMVQPGSDEQWLLITSAYHMPRSVGVFCGQQWAVTPFPVDHGSITPAALRFEPDFANRLTALTEASHEWLGLLVYYLTGKTEELLPKGCAQTE